MGNTISLHSMTRCIGIGLAIVALFFAAGTALANISPAGCTANNLSVNFAKDQTQIVSGTTVHYTVTISNGGASGCDIADTDVVFHCPGADGNPLLAGVSQTDTRRREGERPFPAFFLARLGVRRCESPNGERNCAKLPTPSAVGASLRICAWRC